MSIDFEDLGERLLLEETEEGIEFDLIKNKVVEPPASCKGLFFRGRKNYFINSQGVYTYTERLVPLKRMSCTGCEHCGFLLEALNEQVYGSDYPAVADDFVDGQVYELKVIDESRDYETGYVDEYEVGFKKVV